MTETEVLAIAAATVAVVAAARSTWSPCGLSMLSTITPLAERGRGHRWGATASWFVAGQRGGRGHARIVRGGPGRRHRATRIPATTSAVVAGGGALVAAASDSGLGGFRLPIHRRQVNERWLDGFRPWVYGSGFGWQIGTGVTTYIKTAAVYLMVCWPPDRPALGRPRKCAGFGLVRGLACSSAHGITSPGALADFHRRFMDRGPLALAVVVGVEVLVGSLAAGGGAVGLGRPRRRHHRRRARRHPPGPTGQRRRYTSGGSRTARTA